MKTIDCPEFKNVVNAYRHVPMISPHIPRFYNEVVKHVDVKLNKLVERAITLRDWHQEIANTTRSADERSFHLEQVEEINKELAELQDLEG